MILAGIVAALPLSPYLFDLFGGPYAIVPFASLGALGYVAHGRRGHGWALLRKVLLFLAVVLVVVALLAAQCLATQCIS